MKEKEEGFIVPEGSEVYLSAELIRPLIQDRIVVFAKPSLNGRYAGTINEPTNYQSFLVSLSSQDCKVSDIQVKGKFMYWTFSNGWIMFCTFGMTGQWSNKQGKHPCFIFQYQDKDRTTQELFFNDPRHFGTISFTNNQEDLAKKLDELGWSPLHTPIEEKLDWVITSLANNKKTIGEVLLNQKTFAGVGNYIRAEALFKAGISPWRSCKSLSSQELTLLCHSIVEIMKTSVEFQGATISTYATPFGEEGKYSSCFKVYDQKLDPHGHTIVRKTTADKRMMHFCPICQV